MEQRRSLLGQQAFPNRRASQRDVFAGCAPIAIIERAGDSIVWDAGSQKDELVGHPRAGLLKKDGELFSLAIDPKNHAVVSGGLGRVLFRTLEREMPTDVVLWASAADWASWVKEGDSGRRST